MLGLETLDFFCPILCTRMVLITEFISLCQWQYKGLLHKPINYLKHNYLPIFQRLKSPKKWVSKIFDYFSSLFWQYAVVTKRRKNQNKLLTIIRLFWSILSNILNSESQFFEFLVSRNRFKNVGCTNLKFHNFCSAIHLTFYLSTYVSNCNINDSEIY